MNKSQLVEQIAKRSDLPSQDVAKAVDALIDVVRTAVAKGDKVVLSGFGTFYRRPRAKRTARNVWADTRVVVPATNVPAFRAGQPFKDAVSKPRRRRPTKRPARSRRG
jgi:DNA-binding protein HU-beta